MPVRRLHRKKRVCPKCNVPPPKCPKCGEETTLAKMQTDMKALSPGAGASGERAGDTKGVLGLSSRDKTPEPLEKGILRAKHGINIFKDGTVRYDLTDLPLTHFRSDEIGTSPEILEFGLHEGHAANP
jgi:DNA polymerase II large subunit